MPASPCLHLPLPASALTPCLLALVFVFAPVSIHYHVRQDHRASCGDCPAGSPADHCVCLRRCPSSVLQGLPCRPAAHGDCIGAARAPVVFTTQLRSFQGGGLGLHWAAGHLLCPYLHLFHEPETAFGQPGSLLQEWPVGWHMACRGPFEQAPKTSDLQLRRAHPKILTNFAMPFFPTESISPGPWFSVKFTRLRIS